MEAYAHSEIQPQNLSKCVGETVSLTCSVCGTVQTWKSDEYIGSELQFGYFDISRIGTPIHSTKFNTTFVVILRIYTESNANATIMIIESKLTVRISINGTIACMDDKKNTSSASIIARKLPCPLPFSILFVQTNLTGNGIIIDFTHLYIPPKYTLVLYQPGYN